MEMESPKHRSGEGAKSIRSEKDKPYPEKHLNAASKRRVKNKGSVPLVKEKKKKKGNRGGILKHGAGGTGFVKGEANIPQKERVQKKKGATQNLPWKEDW